MACPRRSCRLNRSSAEKIGSIDHLLMEILKRLPANDLLNYKCVCKQYLGVINSYNFSSIWNPTLKSCGLLLEDLSSARRSKVIYLDYRKDQIISRAALFSRFPLGKIKILQFCNGLSLCIPNCANGVVIQQCYVCNLTTKKFVKLHVPGYIILSGLAMAFDPKKSENYYVYSLQLPSARIFIYSSQTRSWELVKLDHSIMLLDLGRPTYWNGGIYWTNLQWRFDLQLDIEAEKKNLSIEKRPSCQKLIGNIDIPADAITEYCYFGVCQGNLYIIERIYAVEMGTVEFVIFERSLCTSWTVKYSIKLEDVVNCLAREEGYMIYKDDILSIISQEENMELAVVISLPGKVISYCPESKTAKTLHRFVGEHLFKAHQIIESMHAV